MRLFEPNFFSVDAAQRRLLAERKFGSQAKHVAEGRGAVEKRVKGITKRTNQIDPKTGLAIGDDCFSLALVLACAGILLKSRAQVSALEL
jgi:hypothetical protein